MNRIAITEEERREEEKRLEERLREKGVVPEIEYGMEWRKIAPPKVVKPGKGEKFPLLQKEIRELLETRALGRKIDEIYRLKAEFDKIKAKLEKAEEELKQAEQEFTRTQDLRLDQLWLAVGEITGNIETVLNVAYQWKQGAEVLIAFRTELESEEFERLMEKNAETILKVGRELGLITDEMIKKIEQAIDEANKGIIANISRFIKRFKITLWPAAKADRPKLSSFNKVADIIGTLKDLWGKVVEFVRKSVDRILRIKDETKELADKAIDLSYELEEVGEVYRRSSLERKGWRVPIDYERGDVVCLKWVDKSRPDFREKYCGEVLGIEGIPGVDVRRVAVKMSSGIVRYWSPLDVELFEKGVKRSFEEKFGVKVEILAENVAKVNDELVVEKTAEDLSWKLFDILTKECGCEKRAVEYIEVIVDEYADKVAEGSRSKTGAGWAKLPRGWTMESVRKFWNSLTGDVKHKVTKCIEIMEDKMDDPAAFCASIKDMIEGTTYWRGRR
jgi:hypothetical protein